MPEWFSPFWKQLWTTSGAIINMFSYGMVSGYPACLLPALQAPESPIKTDIGAASWLASASGTAGVLGIFLAAALMDSIGRRKAFILNVVLNVIGWLLIYIGENIPTLMVGRVLGGISGGATANIGAIVIGEYVAPKYRGVFLSTKSIAISAGSLVVHSMGHFLSWRTVALMAILPQCIAISIAYTWPESPAWLASKKKYELSERAFFWLRGRDEGAMRELEEFVQAQKEKSRATNEVSVYNKKCLFIKKFKDKSFIKPTTILILAAILVEASGKHIYPAYAKNIIGTVTSDSLQSFYYILVIDFIITASITISTIFVKNISRRTLLFSTSLISVIVLMFLCLYLFLVAKNIIVTSNSWVPISSLIIYFIFVNLGCTTMPNILLGEIFPLEHKGFGTCVSALFVTTCMFTTLKGVPYMLLTIKFYGTFFIFGIIMIILLILLYFILPETKDKTLQQIEDYFNYGTFNINRVKDDDERKSIVNEALTYKAVIDQQKN